MAGELQLLPPYPLDDDAATKVFRSRALARDVTKRELGNEVKRELGNEVRLVTK